MRRGGAALATIVLTLAPSLLTLSPPAQETPTPPPEEPREANITERVEARLAQLDVTVSGPKDLVSSLTRDDFMLKVNLQRIPDFIVDRVCQPLGEGPVVEAPAAPAPSTGEAPGVRRSSVATYLFYFDQPHLTMAGRQAAIDTARELVPKLVQGGNRAMIVSNAEEVKTIAPLTRSADVLLAALDRLEHDRDQWDLYAEQETKRLAQVQEALDLGIDHALALARTYEVEERWRQEKDLARLAMVLGRFVDLDPPKVVLYFADTMRTNAGEHYLGFFGRTLIDRHPTRERQEAKIRTDAFSGMLPLNRVINEAAAHGIRFYTVEARGMTPPEVLTEARRGAAGLSNAATPTLNYVRIRDAQNTLVSLAMETGGRAFLNGIPGTKIARGILEDLGCLYLVSFDPTGFPEDKPLTVTVKLKRPNLKAQVRGVIVLQSASSKLTSRLLSAFSAPEASHSDIPIRVGVIPTGFNAGRFGGRVQVAIPGTVLPGSAWDLGASVVTEGEVRSDASGHVAVTRPGVPIILERDMTFSPGPFELVAVAHEKRSEQMASRRVESEWPKLESALATLGPIVILQPTAGAFLRNGQKKESGPLIRGEGDALRADLKTVFVGIVCRSRDEHGPLQVERLLTGETEAPFETLSVDLGSDRCALFQDRVRENTMTEGSFRYGVRVLDRGTEVAKTEKSFVVLEGAEHPRRASSQAPDG